MDGLFGWAALVLVGCRGAASPAAAPVPTASTPVVRYFNSIRGDTTRLIAFLREMPKGGDLHNHLGGAVYAESMIRWAGADGLCLTLATLSLSLPPCALASDRPAVSTIAKNTDLYGKVIDAWSMRNFDYTRQIGHDHFFDTFGKFGLANNRHVGDMLAEVSSRAASDHVAYLELMQTLDGGIAAGMAARVGYTGDFAVMRDRLLRAGLVDSLRGVQSIIDAAEGRRLAQQHCGTTMADSACSVTIRYLYQVLRGLTPEVVFAQILTGFELARKDSRVVGFNLVMPEDAAVPMRDFSLHMSMIDYLHRLYPEVHITLHAGELVASLVPAPGLTFHIRESIEKGHAERIGHGVDVMGEHDADGLLKMMAARHVLVEIALTSNDGILGIRGAQHPLATYLKYGVPVALSTDDEGVSRSDMTHEFLRAVIDQHLDYPTLKQMARNSITYSFAEPLMKERLLREFDAAVGAFEGKWGR